MVKIPREVEGVIKDYLKELGSDISIEKAILFGSYAKGNYGEDSDIDLAIFSDYFKDISQINGIRYLLKRTRNYKGLDIQAIPFVKEDYEKQIDFAKEIILTGIEINLNKN